MNTCVYNGDINGVYCYMNTSTRYESNDHNFIYYTNRRDKHSTNIYVKGNNGLLDGVAIHIILSAPTLKTYFNI